MGICTVCNHSKRDEIELALFRMSSGNATGTLTRIAAEYDISIEELQRHALFHTSFNCEPDGDSIVRQIKMREADMLAAAAMDQLETVRVVGRRVRRFAKVADDDDVRFERTLTKSVVDLYVGAGDCLRKNVQTLADIDQLLNGSPDEGASGLAGLAAVLRESRKNTLVTEDADAQ